MFDSGITAKQIIEEIQNEADIAPDIPEESYIQWLNTLEQLLYREVIREQNKFTFSGPRPADIEGGLDIEQKSEDLIGDVENVIRFEDIHAVYADGKQLMKSTYASGRIFPDTYYKQSNRLGLNLTDKQPKNVDIIYIVRPALKTPADAKGSDGKNVMVPVEFIDLVKAKLRGEAYKLANEGDLAAMWLNDYNVLLENFKAWVAEKQPAFGV